MRRVVYLSGLVGAPLLGVAACDELYPYQSVDPYDAGPPEAAAEVFPPHLGDSPCERAGYTCRSTYFHPKGGDFTCGVFGRGLPYSCRDSAGNWEELRCCSA